MDAATLAVVGVLLVVLLGFAVFFGKLEGRGARGGGRGQPGGWAVYASARRHLMTRSERDFEGVLRNILDEERCGQWGLHVQVAMSAVFEGKARPVGKGAPGPWVPPWCLDFVLTDAGGVIRGIVELNDPSHRRWDRKRRDSNLEAGCERLGVPLLFVKGNGREKVGRWLRKVR